jgi:hypothetical protein
MSIRYCHHFSKGKNHCAGQHVYLFKLYARVLYYILGSVEFLYQTNFFKQYMQYSIVKLLCTNQFHPKN